MSCNDVENSRPEPLCRHPAPSQRLLQADGNGARLLQRGGAATVPLAQWRRLWNHQVPIGFQLGRSLDGDLRVVEQRPTLLRQGDLRVHPFAGFRHLRPLCQNPGAHASGVREHHLPRNILGRVFPQFAGKLGDDEEKESSEDNAWGL